MLGEVFNRRNEGDFQRKFTSHRANLQIEVAKLQKLLIETLDILKFAMCVPHLVLKQCGTLEKISSRAELCYLKKTLGSINFQTCSLFGEGEYEFRRTNFFTESSASSVEKFYTEYKEQAQRNMPSTELDEVFTLIHMLYTKSLIHEGLCPTEIRLSMPDHVKEMIDSLEELFAYAVREMGKSPKEVEEREIEMSRMFVALEDLAAEMLALHGRLRPSFENNLLNVAAAYRGVKGLKDQRRKLREFLVNSYHRIKSNLEKHTMLYNLDAMKTTKEKIGPRRELMAKHKTLVSDNLAEEKTLRTKKYKAEQVLQGVIKKYEKDMDDRNTKFANLTKLYQEEMTQMQQMQDRFNAQEKVYSLLMEEKAQFELALWTAQLNLIQKKIAARKIQRFYREYLGFMRAHGRKKGKGRRSKKRN